MLAAEGQLTSKHFALLETKEFNNLNGPLPWEIIRLANLKNIWLTGNQLSGTIPSGFDHFGSIRLEHNRLGGTIPSDLFSGLDSKDTSVHETQLILALHNNQLTGTIPTEVGLSRWSVLAFSGNSLSGSLPVELWNAEGLLRISFDDNPKVNGSLLVQERLPSQN